MACDNWQALSYPAMSLNLGKTMRACSYRGIACAGPIFQELNLPVC